MNKFSSLLLGSMIFVACEEVDNDRVANKIPSVYEFTRDNESTVNYSGQKTRLDMLESITTYLKDAIKNENDIDSTTLINMFKNQNNPFNSDSLNASGKSLYGKCADPDLFIRYFHAIDTLDQKNIIHLQNGTSRLYTKQGLEYVQLIEKGMMGAVFYSQITSNYTTASKISGEANEPLVEGKNYTYAEHHWDEAFGYLGVPVNFSANTKGVRFYGKYCDERNQLVGTNAIMDAFLEGRVAITHGDAATREVMANKVRKKLGLVVASTAIHYLNSAIKELSSGNKDDLYHALSEAVAFINTLRYNETDPILDDAQIDDLLEDIWTQDKSFLLVNNQKLNSAINTLAIAYNLEEVKFRL